MILTSWGKSTASAWLPINVFFYWTSMVDNYLQLPFFVVLSTALQEKAGVMDRYGDTV